MKTPVFTCLMVVMEKYQNDPRWRGKKKTEKQKVPSLQAKSCNFAHTLWPRAAYLGLTAS